MVSSLANTGKTNFQKAQERSTIARGFPVNTNHVYTPEEAQAMIANLVANPIPAVNGTRTLETDTGIFGALRARYKQGSSGYHVDDLRIDQQPTDKPQWPESKYTSISSVGKVIPISMGKRRITGTLISCSAITPNMVGGGKYTVDYQIPIYEDPPINPTYGFQLDTSGGNDPGTGDGGSAPTTAACSQNRDCDTKNPARTPPSDTPTDNPTDPPDGSGVFWFANGYAGGPGSLTAIHNDLLSGSTTFLGADSSHYTTESAARSNYNSRVDALTPGDGEGAYLGEWNGTTNTLLHFEGTGP